MSEQQPLVCRCPKVLAIGVAESDFPGAYLLLEKVRGLPLPPVWRPARRTELLVSPDDLKKLLVVLGQHLRRLHSIRLQGYGRLGERRYAASRDVRGQTASWRQVVLDPAHEAVDWMESRRLIDTDEAHDLRDSFQSNQDELGTCSDARLLHGDLAAKHVYVDPSSMEITALIDFGDGAAGEPALDLANFVVWEDRQRTEWLCDGYADSDLTRRLSLYALATAIKQARDEFAAGPVAPDDPTVTQLMPRLRELLNREEG